MNINNGEIQRYDSIVLSFANILQENFGNTFYTMIIRIIKQ